MTAATLRKENQVKEAKKEEEKKKAETKHVYVLLNPMRAACTCLLTIENRLVCSAPVPTSLFLSHNESLAPPYRVLVDTNFINLSLDNRIEMITGMMDSLYAKCELRGGWWRWDVRAVSALAGLHEGSR